MKYSSDIQPKYSKKNKVHMHHVRYILPNTFYCCLQLSTLMQTGLDPLALWHDGGTRNITLLLVYLEPKPYRITNFLIKTMIQDTIIVWNNDPWVCEREGRGEQRQTSEGYNQHWDLKRHGSKRNPHFRIVHLLSIGKFLGHSREYLLTIANNLLGQVAVVATVDL